MQLKKKNPLFLFISYTLVLTQNSLIGWVTKSQEIRGKKHISYFSIYCQTYRMNACLSLRPCSVPFLTVSVTCTAYKGQQDAYRSGILVQPTRNSTTLVVAGYLYSLQATAGRLSWRDTCTAYKQQQNGWCGGILVQPTRNSTTHVVASYLYSLQGTAVNLSWRDTCTAYKEQQNACRSGILAQPTSNSRTVGVAGYLYSLQGTAERLVWKVICTTYKEQHNACRDGLLVQLTRNSRKQLTVRKGTLQVLQYLQGLQYTRSCCYKGQSVCPSHKACRRQSSG